MGNQRAHADVAATSPPSLHHPALQPTVTTTGQSTPSRPSSTQPRKQRVHTNLPAGPHGVGKPNDQQEGQLVVHDGGLDAHTNTAHATDQLALTRRTGSTGTTAHNHRVAGPRAQLAADNKQYKEVNDNGVNRTPDPPGAMVRPQHKQTTDSAPPPSRRTGAHTARQSRPERQGQGHTPDDLHAQQRPSTVETSPHSAMDKGHASKGDAPHHPKDQGAHAGGSAHEGEEPHPLPEFLQIIEYPTAGDDIPPPNPLEEDEASAQQELEADNHIMVNPMAISTLDTAKWPFPHPRLRDGTARIYDAVRSSSRHNHEACRIPLPTALNIEAWEREGRDHPQDEMVIEGIKFGFPIQYCGPPQYQAADCPNHASAKRFPVQIQNYIDEEVAHGALEGPFNGPPFTPWWVTSPLMTREKTDSEDRRIIVDLSFPDGGINKHILPHVFNGREATHNLPTIELAVAAIAAMCPGTIQMAVVDLSRAYRQLAVSPLDWPLLGIRVGGAHYFDRRLPFGARMSSYTMQMAADFIIRAIRRRKICAYMYLDDIVIIGPTPQLAVSHYEQTLRLLDDLGLQVQVQVAAKKLQPPSPQVRWLGIDFDVERNTISIPERKLREIQRCMAAAAKSESITKKQLQRIIGLANHLAKVVRAARIFIGRILAALRAAEGDTITVSHHVRADLKWFARYLAAANARAILPNNRVVLRIWADTCMEGAGASDGARYYTYHFPRRMTEAHHISQLEALNCTAAARAFINSSHAGGTVEIHCDNKSSVDAFKSGRAKDPVLAACTRALWFKAAEEDVTITFTHVPGEAMALPDALSRVHVDSAHRDMAKRLIASLHLKPIDAAPTMLSYAAFI